MEDKLKILLCEDDENLGMLLREYLQAKDTKPNSAPTVKPDTVPLPKANSICAYSMS